MLYSTHVTLTLLDAIFAIKRFASSIFPTTFFMSLLFLFLYSYLPRRFMLNNSSLHLDRLQSHRVYLQRTRFFYKKLTQALADMIFARSVKMPAPMEFFESEQEQYEGEETKQDDDDY